MTEKIADTATVVTYAASATAVVSGLTLTDWGVISGITIGILTYLTNWYFRRREARAILRLKELETEEAKLRIARQQLELEGVKIRQRPRTEAAPGEEKKHDG